MREWAILRRCKGGRVWSRPRVPAICRRCGWVAAARAQVGVATVYDPASVMPDFRGGDVDRTRGVCADVVIRAFCDAPGIDLQRVVNRDMSAAFAQYRHGGGLTRPDRNIDQRRVGNLRRLAKRGTG